MSRSCDGQLIAEGGPSAGAADEDSKGFSLEKTAFNLTIKDAKRVVYAAT